MNEYDIILGVDPGTQITGYGIIKIKNQSPELLDVDIIDLRNIADSNQRLKTIFDTIIKLINLHNVNKFAIEAPFFGKNVQSMLKLGKAQGVAIAAALSKDLSPVEYSPRKVKMAVTGNGNASKEQVAIFLNNLLKTPIQTRTNDATDGLAVAICHAFSDASKQYSSGKSKGNKWKDFINQNPGRVIK